MQTVTIQISQIKHSEYNPRIMPEKQMEDLMRSIQEFGFIEPIVVNSRNNIVISGHQRLNAAMRLKMKEVPGVYINLDPSKERALNIAMNKIGGFFDDHLLLQVIEDIAAEDMPLTGFDEGDIDAIMERIKGEDEKTEAEKEVSFTAGAEREIECPKCGHEFRA